MSVSVAAVEAVAALPAGLALADAAPLAAGEDEAFVPTDEMFVPLAIVFGRPITWKSFARFALELAPEAPDEPDAGLRSTTRPGKFAFFPVALELDDWNAGFTLSIAGPLPFAMTSTVQPIPFTPAFMFGCGTATWRSMYFDVALLDADAGADAATDVEARADAAADPFGELLESVFVA